VQQGIGAMPASGNRWAVALAAQRCGGDMMRGGAVKGSCQSPNGSGRPCASSLIVRRVGSRPNPVPNPFRYASLSTHILKNWRVRRLGGSLARMARSEREKTCELMASTSTLRKMLSASSPASPARVTRTAIKPLVWVRLNFSEENRAGAARRGLPWRFFANCQTCGSTAAYRESTSRHRDRLMR